jgi:hypothetical protein
MSLDSPLVGSSGQQRPQPWQPPTAEELQKMLPQYEITHLLGRGGMGAVYKGRQITLDRAVAIKILSNDLEAADASFAERFKNEARAMAKLSHAGIVTVHESGQTVDGLLYIVMEFIEGTDVSRMIAQQGRLHTEHAMAITAHVCDALQYAHERGIIHRDIKPANIMIGYDGVVKVADFGLAKMSQTGDSGLTQSGVAMGTLHYMAPEALTLGNAVDHRADVYAVGVMLYQMLVGKLPQGMFELPSLQVPGLDPRYDGIIAKALRDDREIRYQSAREMRQDLDGIVTQPVVRAEGGAAAEAAALPTEIRPRPDGGQPFRPPQAVPRVVVARQQPSSPWLWLAVAVVILLAAIGGRQAFKPVKQSQLAQPVTVGAEPAFTPSATLTSEQRKADAIWRSRWGKPGKLRLHSEGVTSQVSIAATEAYDDFVQVVAVPPGAKQNVPARWMALRANGELIGSKPVKGTDGKLYIGIVMGYQGAPDILIREGGIPEVLGQPVRDQPVIQARSFRPWHILGMAADDPAGNLMAFQNLDGTWSLAGKPVDNGLRLPDLSSAPAVKELFISDMGVTVVRDDGGARLYGKTETPLPTKFFSNVKAVNLGRQMWYVLGANGVLNIFKMTPQGTPDLGSVDERHGIAELGGSHYGTFWRSNQGAWLAHTPDQAIIDRLNSLKPETHFLAIGPNGDLLFWIEPK